MELMPMRLQQLIETMAGLMRTGRHMVAFDGSHYYAAGSADEPGMYLFVPWLADTFGMSVQGAVDLFLVGLVVLGAAIGGVGVLGALESRAGRVIGLVGLALLARHALRMSDVYIASFVAVTVSTLPVLALLRRCRPGWVAVSFGALGLLLGGLNLVRGQSALAGMVFVVIVTATHWDWSRRDRLQVLGAFAAGVVLVGFAFSQVTQRADEELAAVEPVLTSAPPVGEAMLDPWHSWRGAPQGHPLWHAIYVGFGHEQPNKYDIRFYDGSAAALVAETDPAIAYGSDEYEDILREEVIDLVRSDPGFVVGSLFSKVPATARTFLVYANVGLIAVLVRRPPLRLLLAFVVGIGVSAAPGILVMPRPSYLVGLATFAGIFGLWAVDRWLAALGGAAQGDLVDGGDVVA